MKKSLLCALWMVATLAAPTFGAEKITVAVDEFRNDTSAGWWKRGTGSDLAGMLSNELSSSESFRVVERKKLTSVLAEQDLAASGRVAPKKAAEIGKLTGAEYLVMATVTAYEEEVSSRDAGFRFGGVSLGGGKEEAYLAVDLRVVNTTTGEIEFSRTVEGRASGGGLKIGVSRDGFGGTLGGKEKTPAGKAIRAAVVEISEYLECVMVDQDACLETYQKKEKKRREKTKDAVSLDE